MRETLTIAAPPAPGVGAGSSHLPPRVLQWLCVNVPTHDGRLHAGLHPTTRTSHTVSAARGACTLGERTPRMVGKCVAEAGRALARSRRCLTPHDPWLEGSGGRSRGGRRRERRAALRVCSEVTISSGHVDTEPLREGDSLPARLHPPRSGRPPPGAVTIPSGISEEGQSLPPDAGLRVTHLPKDKRSM